MSIRKIKKGKYQADFYVGDKRVRVVRNTKKACEDYIRERKRKESTFVASSKRKNFDSLTYDNIADRYGQHLSKGRASGNVSYLKKSKAAFGPLKISEITTPVVEEWVEYLFGIKDDDGKPLYAISTVEKFFTYLKSALNYSVKKEIISHNPIAPLQFRKEFGRKNARNRVISREEFEELKALIIERAPKCLLPVQILWFTGMRIGEVLSLSWKSVFFDRGVIVLSGEHVKEGKTRTIGIEIELYAILTEINKTSDMSCIYPGTYSTVRNNWLKAIKDTSFEGLTLHDLRHCYATIRRREGHDKEVIKKQLGHSTDSMFRRYNTVSEDEVVAMAGLNREKMDLIRSEVKALVDKVKENDIPVGTMQALIREYL